MSPEQIIEIIEYLKQNFSFLYDIILKQAYVDLIKNWFFSLLSIPFTYYFFKYWKKLNEKDFDYLSDEEVGFIIYKVVGICILCVFVVHIFFTISYSFNVLLNPDYIVYQKLLEIVK